jgi:hypothetical protein
MTDRQLTRKLVLIVLIKLVLLTCLWWFFVHNPKTTVSDESMAQVIQTEKNQPVTGETRHGH